MGIGIYFDYLKYEIYDRLVYSDTFGRMVINYNGKKADSEDFTNFVYEWAQELYGKHEILILDIDELISMFLFK